MQALVVKLPWSPVNIGGFPFYARISCHFATAYPFVHKITLAGTVGGGEAK